MIQGHSKDKKRNLDDQNRLVLTSSAPFHYKSFFSNDDSYAWYSQNRSVLKTSNDSIIQFAKGAHNPFQFIANVLSIEENLLFLSPQEEFHGFESGAFYKSKKGGSR
ncbi:hypothetical protein HPP92_006251 [Vanilla planifolia]|uniref:Uncharacterized protein n=1 Tax=Vanilla planifolia TaxID=51239 RepID=A0A835S150_VANPL|nr:hypothetical protein HPP92_006251 [Vanilla planifolia]